MGYEQLMNDDIFATFGTDPRFHFHNFIVRGNGDKPDLVFELMVNGIDYLFCLESKTDEQPPSRAGKPNRNKANYSKQIFGEILKNRNSRFISSLTISKVHTYGVLFNYPNQVLNQLITFLSQWISPKDWDDFGTNFNSKYVFLYDQIAHKLYYCDWQGFIKKPNPVAI